MKRFNCFLLCLFLSLSCFCQENNSYKISLKKDGSVIISRRSDQNKSIRIIPKFLLLKRSDDPAPFYRNADKKDGTNYSLAYWKTIKRDTITPNYFETALPVYITALSASLKGNKIEWVFKDNSGFSAHMVLPTGDDDPVISYTYVPKEKGFHSIGFVGMPEVPVEEISALWQPWIWQEKRFPPAAYLSPNDMSPLPATLVEKGGVTYGLVADPKEIPYRFPSLQQKNLKSGVAVRSEKGLTRPTIFAPVLGMKSSFAEDNPSMSFSFRLMLFDGALPQAHRYIAERIYGFKDYRKNVFTNLNQTIENITDYGMNDGLSGWNAELRGYDYTADVARTVKIVSALHPLSVALITDNESIYRLRGLPMTEFNLSRERFLFTIHKDVNGQQASSKMSGPGVEVAELGALQSFYRYKPSIFSAFADSTQHLTRRLNLLKMSPGDSWPNLLGLFKMTGDSQYLRECIIKADQYVSHRIDTPQRDFSDNDPVLETHFWTDYAPLWIELLDLYETTKNKRYLNASVEGAKRYTQYIWFQPKIPLDSIAVKAGPGYEMSSVPAWWVSEIGLTPEAANTFHANHAIFIAPFAAHFLRLAYYANDPYFRAIGRSAIIGRYSNFPNYAMFNTYRIDHSRPDFPINAALPHFFYYNHIWPLAASLYDYLISDVFVQSNAQITFPNEFVPGYAYMKSKVYGHKPGRFYTDDAVYLWMPKQLLHINSTQVNYITGYGNNNFYGALLNQSDDTIHVEVDINPTLVLSVNKNYPVRLWMQNQLQPATNLTNGKLALTIYPKGITAFSVAGLTVPPVFQKKYFAGDQNTKADFKIIPTEVGNITSTTLSFGKNLNSVYTWLEASIDQIKGATYYYRYADSDKWESITDKSFPFEFSIPLDRGTNNLEFKLEIEKNEGSEIIKTGTYILSKATKN